MTSVLHIDFESRSELDLTIVGTDNYAKHPSTYIWVAKYAIDQGPVREWTPEDYFVPEDIERHMLERGEVAAFSAQFEYQIWNEILTKRYDWPALLATQVHCVQARGYAMALPGSLALCAPAAGISSRKDDTGHRLMLRMCRPRGYVKEKPIWWIDHSKKQRLFDYCADDVKVARELDIRLAPLSKQERKVWLLDQKINYKGVKIDRPLIQNCIKFIELAISHINAECDQLTNGEVTAISQIEQIKDWINAQSVTVESIAKDKITDLLRKKLPSNVRRLLELRQEGGKTSTAKLRAMLNCASSNDRIKNMFQYHGASTGRWAGRKVQLHNMPRPAILKTQKQIETVIELINAQDFDTADLLHGSPMQIVSDLTRSVLVAGENCEFLCNDFNSVEGVVLPWLAGEQKVLDTFLEFGELYKPAAVEVYRVAIDKVTSSQRQVGKVVVLSMGYGGGVGAFQQMAVNYGVKVTDEKAEQIKLAFRAANPNIVNYWYALERAAVNAVRHPGVAFGAGPKDHRRVKFKTNGSFLRCRLPNGKMICYPYPKIKPVETPWGQFKDALIYKGRNSRTNQQWVDLSTYGGKLAENITQATARELLAEAMLRLDALDYNVVMHIHDEIICEHAIGTKSLSEMDSIMCNSEDWAEGLPVLADGWFGKRFRK